MLSAITRKFPVVRKASPLNAICTDVHGKNFLRVNPVLHCAAPGIAKRRKRITSRCYTELLRNSSDIDRDFALISSHHLDGELQTVDVHTGDNVGECSIGGE
jgi:hypothetical protein